MQPDGKAFILHLCTQGDWEHALAAGEYRSASLDREGFIHCSLPTQIQWVANRYYKGQAEMILLWINPSRLTSGLRWETADDKTFPHLYGPLNLDAVIVIQPYPPGPDGSFLPLED